MPAGRPSNIDTIVATRENGEPITVADRITGALRAGGYFEQATAAAGISRETAYGWLRTAGKARIRARGNLDQIDLTDHEQACIRFSDQVVEAEAAWEVGAIATLERMGRGGVPQVKTVEKKNAKGDVLELVTTTESTLPDVRVLMWRLERKIPERYGRRVEITTERDHEGFSDVGERQQAIVDTFAAYLEGVTAGAAEAATVAVVTKPRRRRRSSTPA